MRNRSRETLHDMDDDIQIIPDDERLPRVIINDDELECVRERQIDARSEINAMYSDGVFSKSSLGAESAAIQSIILLEAWDENEKPQAVVPSVANGMRREIAERLSRLEDVAPIDNIEQHARDALEIIISTPSLGKHTAVYATVAMVAERLSFYDGSSIDALKNSKRLAQSYLAIGLRQIFADDL